MSVTVAFLARGLDAGLPAVEAFLESYKAHPAGESHQLVFLVKGWDGIPGRDKLNDLANSVGANLLELPDDGFDLGAYFRLAKVAETEFIFLLNSHSYILRDNWLAIMLAVARSPGVGLVGCTGSWRTIGSQWHVPLFLAKSRWKEGRALRAIAVLLTFGSIDLVRLLKTFSRFPPYPNPHIRSNAMLLRTFLLREFSEARRVPRRKSEAYQLESGRRSLSRFVVARGFAILVCGTDGHGRPPADWIAAETFSTPGQPQLLIADNQTRIYSEASVAERRSLEVLVWGRQLTEPEG